jgi:hypothetical protein
MASADQIAPADGVLKPREGRLRAERRSGQRLAAEDQLVQRVVGDPSGFVAIEIARGQAKDPLPDQIPHRMRNLPRLPRIRQRLGHSLGLAQSLVHRLEQDQPTVRTGVGHVEPGQNRRPQALVSEGQLGYRICRHRVPRVRATKRLDTASIAPMRDPVALVFHRHE